jgi:GTP-dependent dephospho-CoA kinase
MDLAPAHAYRLPEALRPELSQAFGPVVSTSGLADALKGKKFVAVGDVVSLGLKEQGLTPLLFVCDYQTQRGGPSELYRRELGAWGKRETLVQNPAGTITREAWLAIRAAFAIPNEAPVRLVVEGEEDLLGIPCFLEAPVGTLVLYGMPGKGVVVVAVDEPLKERVRALLAKFSVPRKSARKPTESAP